MANDSEKVKSVFDFHPCDTPRGMLYYNLSELTSGQQLSLNEYKLDVIRDNQLYLSNHPEIKVVTSMILKAILKERPKVHVQGYLAKYLTESWQDIKNEIDKCIAEKELKDATSLTMPSAASFLKGFQLQEPEEEASFGERFHPQPQDFSVLLPQDFGVLLPPEPTTQVMCRSILDDLIEKLADEEDLKEKAATTPRRRTSSNFSLQSFIGYPAHFSPTDVSNYGE